MPRSLLAAVLFAALATAQDPSTPALPRLLTLGPVPAAATTVVLHADGTLRDSSARRIDLEGLQQLLAQPPANLVLQIDRQTVFALVNAVLDVCRQHDVAAVQFAAELPDGKAGCFTLALPEQADVVTTLDLRLHRQRPGVPPESARLLLARMQRGLAAAKAAALVLGIEAPGDAPFEQVLQTLAAMPAAEVQQVVLRCALTNSQQLVWQQHQDLAALASACAAAPARALAMDLGPAPCVQLPPLALPTPQPAERDRTVGCRVRAGSAAIEPGGGAGGRYGGRADGRAWAVHGDPTALAILAGNQWWLRQQAADGSFGDAAGKGDVAATALVLLACLGDGSSMRSGLHRDVIQRGVGWLLGQQDRDGRFGEGTTTPHALATYAVAEACGLGGATLLRGSVADAIDWLAAQQSLDGGFGDRAGSSADAMTTASCMTAMESAKFFGFALPDSLGPTVAWFEKVADAATGAHRLHVANAPGDAAMLPAATAAALFSRFFAGQDPKAVPIMGKAADLLLAQADPRDPQCAYWTTYALYQMGVQHWAQWSKRLADAIVKTQIAGGEFQGSWDPPPGGSRLVTTALRVLTLQAYYRYTRLVR